MLSRCSRFPALLAQRRYYTPKQDVKKLLTFSCFEMNLAFAVKQLKAASDPTQGTRQLVEELVESYIDSKLSPLSNIVVKPELLHTVVEVKDFSQLRGYTIDEYTTGKFIRSIVALYVAEYAQTVGVVAKSDVANFDLSLGMRALGLDWHVSGLKPGKADGNIKVAALLVAFIVLVFGGIAAFAAYRVTQQQKLNHKQKE